MIYKITDTFQNILSLKYKRIEFSRYILGRYPPDDINNTYLNTIEIKSPTTGYYGFTSIWDKETLFLNLQIPDLDLGILSNEYRVIYLFYKDLETNEILLGAVLMNPGKTILDLGRNNLIEILNFTYSCSLVLDLSKDNFFLEGHGNNPYSNIFNGEDTDLVEKSSYESWMVEKLSDDSYNHFDTVFINKFGIKTY